MPKDARGSAVAAARPGSLEAYERALRALQTYRGDPLAPLQEALKADPGFALGHVAHALTIAVFFERRFMREALAGLERGREAIARSGPREQALAAATRRIAEGDWHGGTRALDAILVDDPRDALALQAAHLLDFYRGDALNLRNRVSRVLPAWSPSVPGYAYVLGLHAFGYEECNQYADAERAGRRAVELSGDDAWAVHAVGHVHEMQGRIAEGLAWYEQTREAWDGADNGFAYHNAWHTALYRMDAGDLRGALETYDARFGAGTDMALARVDATALLWRLALEGADVASRMAAVADGWERTLEDEGGFYAFNDFHAALSFAAAGRVEALRRLRQRLVQAAAGRDANAGMTREVGLGAVEGVIAWSEQRYAQAAEAILGVRDGAHRFGGSHAQRDLLTLTLVEAARRAGQPGLARHVLSERLVHKPEGRWGRRLLARIGGTALPKAA